MFRLPVKKQRLLACIILAVPAVVLMGSILYALSGPGVLPDTGNGVLRDPRMATPLKEQIDRGPPRFAYSGSGSKISVIRASNAGKAVMTETDDVIPPPPLNPDIVLLFSRKEYVPDSGKTKDLDLSTLIAMVAGADPSEQPKMVPPPMAIISDHPAPAKKMVDDDRALHQDLATLAAHRENIRVRAPTTAALPQYWTGTIVSPRKR